MDSSHPVNLTHGNTAQPRYTPQVSDVIILNVLFHLILTHHSFPRNAEF